MIACVRSVEPRDRQWPRATGASRPARTCRACALASKSARVLRSQPEISDPLAGECVTLLEIRDELEKNARLLSPVPGRACSRARHMSIWSSSIPNQESRARLGASNAASRRTGSESRRPRRVTGHFRASPAGEYVGDAALASIDTEREISFLKRLECFGTFLVARPRCERLDGAVERRGEFSQSSTRVGFDFIPKRLGARCVVQQVGPLGECACPACRVLGMRRGDRGRALVRIGRATERTDLRLRRCCVLRSVLERDRALEVRSGRTLR